jgi:hypothetical protein
VQYFRSQPSLQRDKILNLHSFLQVFQPVLASFNRYERVIHLCRKYTRCSTSRKKTRTEYMMRDRPIWLPWNFTSSVAKFPEVVSSRLVFQYEEAFLSIGIPSGSCRANSSQKHKGRMEGLDRHARASMRDRSEGMRSPAAIHHEPRDIGRESTLAQMPNNDIEFRKSASGINSFSAALLQWKPYLLKDAICTQAQNMSWKGSSELLIEVNNNKGYHWRSTPVQPLKAKRNAGTRGF